MVRIINICSGKGGVGKTTVTANLGYALQKLGKRTAIIDFNLTTSHLALQFRFYNYSKTFNDFLRNKINFEESIYIHTSGLSIVPASLELKDLIDIDTTNLKEKIKEVFSNYDFVLLDSAPSLGRESLIALKACDEILFVANPTIPSLIDIVKYKQVLNSLHPTPLVLGILLNRVKGKKYEITSNEVTQFTGFPVIGEIPEDENVLESMNKGVLVTIYKEESPASQAFFEIASKFAGIEYKKPSFFRKVMNIFRK